MTKTRKSPAGSSAGAVSAPVADVLRDPRSGRVVTVRGLGALRNGDLKLREDVNLLQPIAEQALKGD
ncbi:hypothetical protein NPA31_011295 [Aurantimonas sp. MSK8Z-1]|uniref:hypothetical protein n=1 Tax=Mangrovibrevibacter kandeliae TaxID=2968473 RepID=UPI0021180907|nr:hypothetical protein [Aurantimonas sp. MSK8Z-1]MCW4115547.1 hypothetical protein [Aurantimonas sp. MSK8Z-1]